MKLFQRDAFRRAVVTQENDDKQDGQNEEHHHEIVHVFPVVVIGQQGGDYHRELSAAEHQRIEIGVELASHICGAEHELDAADEPEHEKAFQESDDEAEDDEQVDVGGTRAYPAQKELQGEIDQQQRLAGKRVQHLRDDRVGDGHARRSRVIADSDVLGIGAECVRHLHHAARVCSVEHGDRQDDEEYQPYGQPVGYPPAYGNVKFLCGHHFLLNASVSTIIPARNCVMSSGVTLSKSMRTGMRCCTFTKFPAELSVGTNEYFEPVASDMAVTCP